MQGSPCSCPAYGSHCLRWAADSALSHFIRRGLFTPPGKLCPCTTESVRRRSHNTAPSQCHTGEKPSSNAVLCAGEELQSPGACLILTCALRSEVYMGLMVSPQAWVCGGQVSAEHGAGAAGGRDRHREDDRLPDGRAHAGSAPAHPQLQPAHRDLRLPRGLPARKASPVHPVRCPPGITPGCLECAAA